MELKDAITVVIATSPVPSCPLTMFINEAYTSIRWHLPDVPALILMDGVREEQQCWAGAYDEYKQRLRNKKWHNTEFVEFSTYHHEAGMLRAVFDKIQTPLVLYLQHDSEISLVPIDWPGIVAALVDDEVSSIRFKSSDTEFEGPEWDRGQIVTKSGVPLMKTIQFNNFPAIVVRLDVYRDIFKYFTRAQCHIDEARPVIEQDNWNKYRFAIYNPDGSKTRCCHNNAREDWKAGPKLPTVI